MRNEMKKRLYWKGEEEKRCRICFWEIEGWEHVLERCEREVEKGERERECRRG